MSGPGIPRKPPAPSRRRMTTAQRREFYESAKGEAEFPACNICGLPVMPWHRWVESHMPVPHAFEGRATGVAHAHCNAEHWAKVEAPMVAKAKRQYDRHRGIWVARNPLPGGKDDPLFRKKTMRGEVVDRRTGEAWSRRIE